MFQVRMEDATFFQKMFARRITGSGISQPVIHLEIADEWGASVRDLLRLAGLPTRFHPEEAWSTSVRHICHEDYGDLLVNEIVWSVFCLLCRALELSPRDFGWHDDNLVPSDRL